jgi:DNA-3-methyladenine glycosylase II
LPYRKHLSKDKILQSVIKNHEGFEIEKKENILLFICDSIIGQQLSIKVAAVIFQRFLELFKTKNPDVKKILALPHDTLRSIGLSNSKAVYIKNVCEFFIEKKLTDAKLHSMSNEELFDLLTQIKGIGKWTVEMILMFAMGREDVFSSGDLGLQKAMKTLYAIEHHNQKNLEQKMRNIADNWSPYRTYACLYLWKYFDKE